MVNSRKSETIMLRQVLDAIKTIQTDTISVKEEDFLNNHTIVRACLIMLVHIAELIFKMKKIRADYEFIDDNALKSMRNIIAHDYLAIRGNFIKQAVYHKLPLLKKQVENYLTVEGEKEYTPEEIVIKA